jgi:hypothetical protein
VSVWEFALSSREHTAEAVAMQIGGVNPLARIAGPCVIETGSTSHRLRGHPQKIAGQMGALLILRDSLDKTNAISRQWPPAPSRRVERGHEPAGAGDRRTRRHARAGFHGGME